MRLSEFMAEKVQSVPDIVDFEDYPDSIELQNMTSSPVSLNGYFLNDDAAKPMKCEVPARLRSQRMAISASGLMGTMRRRARRSREATGLGETSLRRRLTPVSITLGARQSDTKDWLDLMTLMSTHDLSVPANWALVEARIDIDSYIDFVVAEFYADTISWPDNREFWRDRKAGGKWHRFLPDMDRTFQVGDLGSNILGAMLGSEDALVLLRTSPQFVQRLAQR